MFELNSLELLEVDNPDILVVVPTRPLYPARSYWYSAHRATLNLNFSSLWSLLGMQLTFILITG